MLLEPVRCIRRVDAPPAAERRLAAADGAVKLTCARGKGGTVQTGIDAPAVTSYSPPAMNTPFRMVLCTLAAVAPAGALVHAADGAAPTKGHVLVLDNERLLQGDVEREGRQYRVRRSGGDTLVAADSVRCVCADVAAAYAFLRAEANLRDPDERLRLARWCHTYGLRTQAVVEATAAVDLRPEDAECKMMLHLLQQDEFTRPARKRPATAPPPPVQATPDVPVDAQVFGQFVTHVQPILMNTCARCHAGDRSGAFKLVRAYGTAAANQRATKLNLAATLRQLNRDAPEASPLLLKAVALHGESAQPPLKDRRTPAYHLLEQWVREEIATAGPETGEPAAAARPAPDARAIVRAPAEPAVAFASERQGTAPAHARQPETVAPATTSAWATDSKTTEAKPTAATQPGPAAPVPVDPFDPLIFNREMHPEVTPEGGG
jgi:hypothetical protein